MAPRLKAFVVWTVLPILFCNLFLSVDLIYRDGVAALSHLFRWKIQSIFIGLSAIEAAVGTVALWVLPFRRRIMAMSSGAAIGIGVIACYAWFAMTFFGGFEENIAIVLNSLLFLFPCFVAGLYAGYLRTTGTDPRPDSEQ
jgi:hypothetical protein